MIRRRPRGSTASVRVAPWPRGRRFARAPRAPPRWASVALRSAGRGSGSPTESCASEIVPRIRAVERFVAEREVGDDIAFDRSLPQRPLEPRGVAQMAARDARIAVEAKPSEDITTESFGERDALAGVSWSCDLGPNFARGQAIEHLRNQPDALLDLANAYPDPRIDVAVVEHRHVERELVVRRIGKRLACIEGAAGGAPDIAARAELLHILRLHEPGRDGAVLQRRGVVVEFDQSRKYLLHLGQQHAHLRNTVGPDIPRKAARHDHRQ